MRLIDADALETHEIYEGEWVRVVYADDIDDAHTIDAEPVIRCKDCEYFDRNGCYNYAISVSQDHFCSSAERRTDERSD